MRVKGFLHRRLPVSIYDLLSLCSVILIFLVAGCIDVSSTRVLVDQSQGKPTQQTATASPVLTITPNKTSISIESVMVMPSSTTEPKSDLRLWISESVPPQLREGVKLLDTTVKMADAVGSANLVLDVAQEGQPVLTKWVFALVAPFPTVTDEVSLQEIKKAWKGEAVEAFGGHPLMMSRSTLAAFVQVWGVPSATGIAVVDADQLLDTAWNNRPSWALVPFEDLEPRWKVLRVEGDSPLDKNFDISTYPLVVGFGLKGDEKIIKYLQQQTEHQPVGLPETNRDAHRLTVVVMTGTTALVRATGAKMEQKGMTYPGQDIQQWLKDADFTHVSNEISFSPDCPPADPNQYGLRFCSRPEYIELLDYVGVNIVELTGNHLLDWGRDAFEYTLQLYRDRKWYYYGGGENVEEARRPLKIEHNGNKLAFIGCNLVGPSSVWATETLSGNAQCGDYSWVKDEIRQVKAEGYLPIVTLQHNEFLSLTSTPAQKQDFIPLAEAGAVIVSGSQAHYPNPFDFSGDRFIHYGLGNLFFDQMDSIVKEGIQREFIDRHVFYNGKYISAEILTAHLEDFSRPRPMTPEERAAFLEEAFKASGW